MAKRRKILYVWSAITGKRVSASTRKRKLNISIGGKRLTGKKAASELARWREGRTTTGRPKRVKAKRQRQTPFRKSGKLVGGVPRAYRSGFRNFLFNLNELTPRQKVRVYALVLVKFSEISPQRGRILEAREDVQPFDLGSITLKQAQRLTDDDIKKMYIRSDRKGEYIRTLSINGLLPASQRKGKSIRPRKRGRR